MAETGRSDHRCDREKVASVAASHVVRGEVHERLHKGSRMTALPAA